MRRCSLCISNFKRVKEEGTQEGNTSDGRGLLFDQPIFCADRIIIQGVREKLCFSQSTANPPSPQYRCKRSFKLNSMWIYCHSYWCAIFCTTNNSGPVLTEVQNFDNYLKKTIFPEHPVAHMITSLSLSLSLSLPLLLILRVHTGDRGQKCPGYGEVWVKDVSKTELIPSFNLLRDK